MLIIFTGDIIERQRDPRTREQKYVIQGESLEGEAVSCVVKMGPTGQVVLIVFPGRADEYLRAVIIAPMTAGGRADPWRIRCRFQRRSGFLALDQLRTVDAERLLRRLGRLTPQTVTAVLRRLREMFAE